MKIVKILGGLVFIGLVGGFAYFALVDVPVRQSEIVQTIPNDRFFDEN